MTVDNLYRLKQQFDDFYQILYQGLTETIQKVQQKKYSPEEMTDIGWMCREMENLCDDLRKECKVKKELIGKILAFSQTQKAINEGTEVENIDGRFARGQPDVTQIPAIPRHGSKEYLELCQYFGVSLDLSKTGVIKFSFNHLVDHITRLAEQGKNPPDGIVKTYPNYKTVFVTKKR